MEVRTSHDDKVIKFMSGLHKTDKDIISTIDTLFSLVQMQEKRIAELEKRLAN